VKKGATDMEDQITMPMSAVRKLLGAAKKNR